MNDERRDDGRRRILEELAAVEALEGRALPEGEEFLKLDPEWVALRRGFDEAFAAVGLTAFDDGRAVSPPPALKERVLAGLLGAVPAPALPPGGRFLSPGIAAVIVAEAPWVVSPIPGIEYKLLHRDSERRSTTRLLRFSAGAAYPSHRHGDVEEVFVVDGTVTLNGILLRPGDYCRAEAGTAEPTAFSETGGMAIIVSSDLDVFDPAPAG